MVDALVSVLILVPILAAVVCYVARNAAIRKLVVLATGAALAVSSILLLKAGGFSMAPTTLLGLPVDSLITFADFALLFVILYIAWQMRSPLIAGLTLLQIVPLAVFKFFSLHGGAAAPAIYADNLSLIMVLIISIIGSAICIYALPYMDEHEHHLHLETSKQPKFFFYLVLFLGAMNGLVLADNIMWLYFFWEVTTLCSFMLIGHDGTEIAKKNAARALWMNLLGGVAFVFGIITIHGQTQTLSVQQMLGHSAVSGIAFLPLVLLCFAGFTKAAQVPFQSWLCGAMVAPTPVSALLHSSTMVKAGVYLVVRLAPAYQGTALSTSVALFGAFTFLVTSALAVGQSNGKKILAYSTIANLGLIITCAGINTPASITAAILLILFHAISKGLLFLCVGAIEQKIGSRDIEDMRGLYARMPRTAVIAIVGVLTMLLPPFGVLLSKWIAIEAASHLVLVVVMLALGSALTVVFWARWAGILLSGTFSEKTPVEEQSSLMRAPLVLLAASAVVVSLFSPQIYVGLIDPLLTAYYGAGAYSAAGGGLYSKVGAFAVYPLFVVLGLGFIYALRTARKTQKSAYCAPYQCGENDPTGTKMGFRGPLGAWVEGSAGNYYLGQFFGEERLSLWINIVAGAMIAMMLGGVL